MPSLLVLPTVDTDATALNLTRGDYYQSPSFSLGVVGGLSETRVTIKKSFSDTDELAVAQALEGIGLVVCALTPVFDVAWATVNREVAQSDGAVSIDFVLRSGLTELLEPRSYVVDVQIKLANGDVVTVMKRPLRVRADVTRTR